MNDIRGQAIIQRQARKPEALARIPIRQQEVQSAIQRAGITREAEQQKISSSVSKVIEDINTGRITSESQIPANLKKYLNIPADYFSKQARYRQELSTYEKQRTTYDAQQREIAEWKQAEKLAFKGVRYDPKSSVGRKIKYLTRYQDLPPEVIAWQKKQAKAPVMEPLKDKFTQLISAPSQFEAVSRVSLIRTPPKEYSTPYHTPTWEVQPAPPRTAWQKVTTPVSEYFREQLPAVKTPTEIAREVKGAVLTAPERIRETGVLVGEKVDIQKQKFAKIQNLREEQIGKSREELVEYYREAGYEVTPDFRAGALITGMVTEKERAEFKRHVTERVSATDKYIHVSSAALNIPVIKENGKIRQATPEDYARDRAKITFIPYRDLHPHKEKITLKEFKEISKFAINVPIAEQMINVNKQLTSRYEDIYATKIYDKYSSDLNAGIITWDDAIFKFNKTQEYKTMLSNYNKEYEKAMKESTTGAVIFGQVAGAGLGLVPDTWGEFGLGAAAIYGVGKVISPRKAVGVIAHDPITQLSQSLYDVAPQPTSFVGQLIKGAGAMALMGPTIGTAYTTQLGKGLITDPFETTASLVEWGVEAPGEFLGFALGGRLRKQVKTQMGKVLSGKFVKPKEITLPSGEKVRVIDVTAPTGEKVRVLLQEGKYSASEKVSVHQELKILAESKGQKFFVHTSLKAIPTKKFKSGEYGIDVTIERGLYLAPESALTMPGTTQAFTEYMGVGGRVRQIGTLKYLWEKIVQGKDLEIAQGGRKAIQILQRKYPNLPQWMQESLLKKGSGLSKTSLTGINKWSNRFDVANKNKKFNVPGLGEVSATEFIKAVTRDQKLSGNKLKSAKAIYQWNLETQKGVIGGPEFITQPFGAEWQLIEPFGKKLEKVSTPRERLLRKLKIERGKEYTMLGEDIIDVSWFMEQKPKPIKVKDIRKKPIPSTPDILSDFFRDRKVERRKIERVKIREPVVSFRAPSLMMDNLIGRPRKPVTRERRPTVRERPRDPFDNLIGRPVVRERIPTTRKRPRDPFDNLIGRPRKPVTRERRPTVRERPPITVPGIAPPHIPTRIKRKYKKIFKKKPLKKKKRYVAKITGFEAALGLGPRYVEAGAKFTGFEAIRGRARKKVKKKVAKKTKKLPKRDEVSNWLY